MTRPPAPGGAPTRAATGTPRPTGPYLTSPGSTPVPAIGISVPRCMSATRARTGAVDPASYRGSTPMLWSARGVTENDTRVASPFNTYRVDGLPAGPISNPGLPALRAALKPAHGDWLWFVATDPTHRITRFTDSEDEFLSFRDELNRNLRGDD